MARRRIATLATVRVRRWLVDLRIDWQPRDLWLGVFVDKPYWEGTWFTRQFFVCIVPMLPLVLSVVRYSQEEAK